MAKYHISKKGVPSICTATNDNCPLGGSDNHFSNIADAQTRADEINQEKFANSLDKIDESEYNKELEVAKTKLADENLSTNESDKIRTALSRQHERYNQANMEVNNVNEMINGFGEPDSGGTFDLNGQTPTTGFCASPYPQYSKVFDSAKDVNFDSLSDYVSNINNSDGGLMQEPETYIGVWNDPATGKIYVDVSKRYDTAQEARKACEDHDQIAFFDLSTFDSVTVDSNAKSGQ